MFTKIEYILYIKKVLKKFKIASFQINIDKCDFYTTKTKYFKLIIILGNIIINPEKIKAVFN